MKQFNIEYSVGIFMIAGVFCLAFLAVELAGISILDDNYKLRARFVSASGLKTGADVELGGVVVGKVTDIRFDPEDYQAEIDISIPTQIKSNVVAHYKVFVCPGTI